VRHIKTLVVVTAVVSTLATGVVLAQQAPPQPDAAKPTPSMPGAGMDAHMAHHMEMCRQMMAQGGMMGPGMMGPGMMGGGMMGGGMMGGGMMGGDPKERAEMMAMRGEMMKAMGDIMLKYAQRARSAK
jgi:hypothetical protein